MYKILKFLRGPVLLSLFCGLLFASPATSAQNDNQSIAAAQTQYEKPEPREAAAILPPEMVKGQFHVVDPIVRQQGYYNLYTLKSDFGDFAPVGDAMLQKTINEIKAIAELKKRSSIDAGVAAGVDSVVNPLQGLYRLVTSPLKSLKGVPRGVYRLSVEGYKGLSRSRSDYEDTDIEAMMSISYYKRAYALEAGVDVYSSNQVLQIELERLSYAAVPGWLVGGGALAVVPTGNIISATSAIEWMNDTVEQSAPLDLHMKNQETIQNWGIDDRAALGFLTTPIYSPRHQTVLVQSLDLLTKTKNRGLFLDVAQSAVTEIDAMFYQRIAEIFRYFNETNEPIVAFDILNRIPVARTSTGRLLVAAPFDHLIWNEEVESSTEALISPDYTPEKPTGYLLWVTGQVSDAARVNIEERGFEVTDRLARKLSFMD